MRSCCLLALCVLFSCRISAQGAPEAGYIVALSGDTVRGQITFDTERSLAQSVFFRAAGEQTSKTWRPGQIAAFGFSRTAYRSLLFKNTSADSAFTETKFCRLIEDGRVRLFALPEAEEYFYIVQREKDIMFLYTTQFSGDGEVRKQANFQSLLAIVSAECISNNQRAETVAYTEPQMARYIHRVNQCLAPDISKSYKEKARLIKSIDVAAGGMKYPYGSQLTGSVLFRLINTGFSPKLSLNMGILYADKNNGLHESYYLYPNLTYVYAPHRLYVHQRLFSVPFTVQWTFATGRIQPFFYGGMGVVGYREHRTELQFDHYPADEDLHFYASFILGAGVDVRLIRQLYFRAEERYEGFPFYPTAGLCYRFRL